MDNDSNTRPPSSEVPLNYEALFDKAYGTIISTAKNAATIANLAAGVAITSAIRNYGLNDPRTQAILVRYAAPLQALNAIEKAAGIDLGTEIKERLGIKDGGLELTIAAEQTVPLLTGEEPSESQSEKAAKRKAKKYGKVEIIYDTTQKTLNVRKSLVDCGFSHGIGMAAAAYIQKRLETDPILSQHAHVKSKGRFYDNTPQVVTLINHYLASHNFDEFSEVYNQVNSNETTRTTGEKPKAVSSTVKSAGKKYITQSDIVTLALGREDPNASRNITKLLKTGNKDLLDAGFISKGSFYRVDPSNQQTAIDTVKVKLAELGLLKPEDPTQKKNS